jgi:methionyl-tRNA formyltransferase
MRIKFFGNRRFVLEEIIRRTSDVEINVIAGTHLEKDAFIQGRKINLIYSKQDVYNSLQKDDFDLFISNGLPYILNLNDVPKKKYVNIHPSYLPDLRGIDPVLGSIIFMRDAGATCHLMDNGIDTGPIISRVKIPFTSDLTASLLYQLSFQAEKKCFADAWDRKFLPLNLNQSIEGMIYFSRKSNTRVIPFSGADSEIEQTVRAFNNKNQGARFNIQSQEVSCYSAWFSTNEFLFEIFPNCKPNEIVLVYEDTVVIKREGSFLFLSQILGTCQEWVGRIVSGR